MPSYSYLIELEVECRRPPDEARIENALEHSTAAEALAEALGVTVRLHPVYDGIELAKPNQKE